MDELSHIVQQIIEGALNHNKENTLESKVWDLTNNKNPHQKGTIEYNVWEFRNK